MAITFLESGSDATYGLEFFATTTGSVASTNSQSKTGPRSISVTGTSSAVIGPAGSFPAAGGRISFYFRITASPDASRAILVAWTTGDDNLAIRTDRKLALRSGTTELAVGTTVFSVDTWYRISFERTWTSSSVNSYRVEVNGVAEISVDNQSIAATLTQPAWQGVLTGAATYFDDLYVDDSSSLTDPGDIRVTAKLPAANNTGGFDTGIGASPSNRYENVDDRALSTATGWQHAATSDAQENYTLQAASVGDVDLSGATIVGYAGWLYGKRGEFDGQMTANLSGGSDKTTNHSTTQMTVTVTNGSRAHATGDAIFVVFACDDDGDPGTTPTCADSRSNTYSAGQSVHVSTTGTGTGARLAIFASLNATALQNGDTITVTHGGSVDASAIVAQSYYGIATSSALDVSTTSTYSGTSGSSGTTGASSSNELLIIGGPATEGDVCHTLGSFSPSAGSTASAGVSAAYGTSGGGAASNMSIRMNGVFWTNGSGGTVSCSGTGENRDVAIGLAVYKFQTGMVSYGSPKLHLNGTDYSITLTTSNALYSQIVTSASYPSAAAGIGMRSSGTTADTFVYECGALVAYIPGVSVIPVPLARRKAYMISI